MHYVKKLATWVVIIAFFVWLINNIDQAIDMLTAAVMFVVGIIEKIATAIANGIDSADAATAIQFLLSSVTGG